MLFWAGLFASGCSPRRLATAQLPSATQTFHVSSALVFRFTKFWEKYIVIIREKWSVGIMINKEWLEPRLA
jgi:hypothetical protein